MGIFEFFRKIIGFKKRGKSANYLIELRLTGDTKSYLKDLIFRISKKFRVKGVTRKHVVPHVTLFGSFKCSDEKELLSRFMRACKANDLPTYELNGFGNFEDRVVHVDINASDELKQLRKDLSDSLIEISDFVQPHDHDSKERYSFHSTLAFKDIDGKFDSIMNYLKRVEPYTQERICPKNHLAKERKNP